MLKIFAFLLSLILVAPAYGHNAYLVQQGFTTDPNGNTLILEKLYGDGIFTIDPARLQLRNRNGAVVAHTQTSAQIAYFCPTISFCWAFAYNSILPFSIGERLATDGIDWDAPVPANNSGKAAEQQFQDYLNGRSHRFSSDGLEYPERNSKSVLHFSPVKASILLSPFIILLDHLWPLVILFSITYFGHYMKLSKATKSATKQNFRLPTGLVTGLGYFTLFIIVVHIATPYLFVLAVYLCARYAAQQRLKRGEREQQRADYLVK